MPIHNRPDNFYNPQAVANQSHPSDPTLRRNDPHIGRASNKPSYTVDEAAKAIAWEDFQWDDNNNDGTIQITYTFQPREKDEAEFNSRQKERVKLSMQSWADVAKVSFRESASEGEGHIAFSNKDIDADGATVLPWGGEFHINPNRSDGATPGLHNKGQLVLTHELGHSLALYHPGNYNPQLDNPNPAKITYQKNAEYAQDTQGHSIMSYFKANESGQDFGGRYPSAPMMADIAAVQSMYGANYNTRNTDTTYGFNSNTDRDFLQLNSPDDALIASIWDGGGNDTLDFSKYGQNQTINLRPGSFSDVGGLKGNVSIAQGVTLENAIGGSGHDVIIGNPADNVLKGGAGADRLRGAAGANTFAYDNLHDSTWWDADQIMDFVSGTDKIELSEMLSKEGLGALKFVQQLSGTRGEAILNYDRHTNESKLYVDTAGRGTFDFFLRSYGQINRSDIIVSPAGTQRYA